MTISSRVSHDGSGQHIPRGVLTQRNSPTDYGCALQKDILVQGRIYASENHLCFHANIFGWVTNVGPCRGSWAFPSVV
jgi:hypothetical protein